ncbi:hypothetical protein [Nocardiopsis alborubida]|uniref:Uncharacterized protein n=1 Tax=Nocardiopsis alborubida TaxID=146802 RepID=A0A7X6MBJ2_9ACTN|nr:hypothetical protein [Nocardiopsis alborubida]NKY96958.1 hypothetical protein [Nocardiopsis alborubida]
MSETGDSGVRDGAEHPAGARAGAGSGTARGAGRPSPGFSAVLVVLAALAAYVGFAGLEQGLRAARGEGAPGVFTVSSITCVQHPGHESCTCNGTFTGDGGGEPRGVYLHAAGRDTCQEGARIPAVDAGASNRVYGPDGSREWILSSFLLAACPALVGGVAANWVRYLRRVARTG